VSDGNETAAKPALLSALVVNESIDDIGILVNAAFVLGLTAGRRMPESLFGPPALDAQGLEHQPLTCIPHYVRKASRGQLRTLLERARGNPEVQVQDYSEEAAPSTYAAYTQALAVAQPADIVYRAVHVIGPVDVITPWTKNLSRR
jgi:hypothetical protein